VTDSKLTLNLVVPDAMAAMEFYEKAFGAVRGEVYHFPNRKGANETNVTVGGVNLRLMDENADYSCFPPKKGEVDSIWLQLEVDDAGEALKKAVACGASVGQAPSEFMGVRFAEITDPSGYVWTVNQILREVSFEERYRFYEESHWEADKKKAADGDALPGESELNDGKIVTGVELDMIVPDSLEALKLYESIFDLQRIEVTDFPRGSNEVVFSIYSIHFHMLDENPDYKIIAPKPGDPKPIWYNITVPDISETYAKALEAGCAEIQPITEFETHGVKNSMFSDPFGYIWMLKLSKNPVYGIIIS
jgi:uncharacterized glyoxalase superfamily protein PhnB